MRIVSLNVNGLRACTKKGFSRFLSRSSADILCLQEVRAFPDQLEPRIQAPKGWHTSFSPAERPGYSGVAIYSREKPSRIETSVEDRKYKPDNMELADVRLGRCDGRKPVLSGLFPDTRMMS